MLSCSHALLPSAVMYTVMYMARMIRKQVYITPEQNERLKREAAKLRVSEAEVIRYGIDALASGEAERRAAWDRILAVMEERGRIKVPQTGRTWTRDDLYDRGSDR